MAAISNSLNGLLANPQESPLLGMAMGLLQSSGASRLPVTMGAALGNGMSASQQYQAQSLQNAMQRIMLPYQKAKIGAIIGALGGSTPGAQQQTQTQGNPVTNTQTLLGNAQLAPATNPVASALSASPIAGPYQGINQHQPQSQQPTANPNAQTNSVADPLQDPEYRKWQMLSLAGVQGAAELAAQRLQMLTADNPQLQQQLAAAKARGQLGPNLVENLVRYAGRPTAITPGQSVVTGLNMFPAAMQRGITGVIGNALGVGNGTLPQNASVSGNQPQQPSSAALTRGSQGMSGAPIGPVLTTTGNGTFPVVTGQSPYNVDLQEGLAKNDATYIGAQQTAADTAAQANNNIDEMWQGYNDGSYTGAFAKWMGGFANVAQSMGLNIDSKSYDNYVSLNKNSVQLGMQLTKSLSSRPSQYEFKYISQNAIANPSLGGQSLPYLMGQMQGANNWQIAKSNYITASAERGVNPRQGASSYDTQASATPLAWASLRKNDPGYFSKVYQVLQQTKTGRAMISKVDAETNWMIKNGIIDRNGNLISGNP